MSVPAKRRQLRSADAKSLAVWASDQSLPEADRLRAQEERDRRKGVRGTGPILGVVVGPGGATPHQAARLLVLLERFFPVKINMPFSPPLVHRACLRVAPTNVWRGSDTIQRVLDSEVVIGLVNATVMPVAKTGEWETLRRAKDRGCEVLVIWPDGSVLEGRW